MLFNRSKVFKCEAAFANSGRCDRFFSGARLLDAEEPLPVQRDEIMADKAMKIPGLDHPSRITSPGSPPRPAIPNNSVRSVRKPRAFSRRTGSARIERLGPAKRALAAAGEARRHQRCRTRIPTFAFVRPWSRRPSRPPRRQREDDRDCGHRWKRGLDRRRDTRTFSPQLSVPKLRESDQWLAAFASGNFGLDTARITYTSLSRTVSEPLE